MTSFIQSMRRYALSALTTLGAVVALIAMSESGVAVPLLADVAGSLRAPTPLVEAKVKTQCVIINGLRVCGKPVKTKNKNKHQDDDSGTQQRESSGCAPGLTLVQGFGCVKPGTTPQLAPVTIQKNCDVFQPGDSGGTACASGPAQCEKLPGGATRCCCVTTIGGGGGGVGQ